MERAVFLDRDGTIVEYVDYLDECSKVRLLPRASKAIELLNENGFKVIIITNQSGVARGSTRLTLVSHVQCIFSPLFIISSAIE